MHSINEQEKYDERESMTDDVDKLRREVQELRGEVAELKAENEMMRKSSNDKVERRDQPPQTTKPTRDVNG
jgi:regulator of replication initiation timing